MAKNPFGCARDCPNRSPGCHDKCESYQTAKKQYLDKQAAIRKERSKQIDLKEAKCAAIKRCIGDGRRRK